MQLELSSKELGEVVAALGRNDYPGHMEFYARLHDKMDAEATVWFNHYYDNMTFSGTRTERLREQRERRAQYEKSL